MRKLLAAALLLVPALLAAEPPVPPRKATPEMRAQLTLEVADLKKQLLTSPSDPELYVKLGFKYARLDMPDEAQAAFENAVRLDPRRAIAHYMLGLIYEKKGMRDKALAAWKACLESAQDPHMKETAERHIFHLSQP